MNAYVSQLIHLLRKTGAFVLGSTSLWLAVFCVMVAVAFVDHAVGKRGAQPVAVSTSTASGWGAEAVQILKDNALALSPIPLANACGLGASSCSRCHNGTRADAPNSDVKTAPWHVDHANVNYSCVGCHQGNPRVLRQDIAHGKLIANPRADAGKHCVSCHAAGEIPERAARYSLNATPTTPHQN